jgi:hypothetical protein
MGVAVSVDAAVAVAVAPVSRTTIRPVIEGWIAQW